MEFYSQHMVNFLLCMPHYKDINSVLIKVQKGQVDHREGQVVFWLDLDFVCNKMICEMFDNIVE